MKQLSKYAIFVHDDMAYGVLALSKGFSEMFYRFPTYISTVLLPFCGRIVYYGLIEVSLQGANATHITPACYG